MNRYVLILLNVALLAAIFCAVPYGMKLYKPIEQNNKAVEALQTKHYDRAIDLLSEAMKENPENDTIRRNLLAAYNSKAIELDQKGQEKEALPLYEKALDLEPKNQIILRNYVSSLNNLAVECSNTRNFPGSQQFFERAFIRLAALTDPKVAVDIQKNYSALLTLWGAELMKRNQLTEAQKAFQDSITLNKANAVANIYLGDLFYESNHYLDAKKFYSSALSVDTDNKEYLSNRLQMIEDEVQVEGRFRETSDTQGRFVIQHVPYEEGVSVPELADILADAYESIGKDLGLYPPRSVNVKIYSSPDFYKISKLPEWAIGIFDGKMRLKVEDVRSAPSQVRDLLFHEYTHAVLAMNIRQRVPAWFHEGLAQLMEPQFAESPREQVQMRDALAKKRLDFAALQESFKDFTEKDDAENAYLLSKYFLVHLKNRYGAEKLVDWIRRMAQEENFDAAFANVYGQPLNQAQEGWIKLQMRTN